MSGLAARGTAADEATWSQRAWGFVCYLGPLFVVPYWLKRNDPFVGFHARQGARGFLVVVLSVLVVLGPPLLLVVFNPDVDPTWLFLPVALLFVILMLVWTIAVVEVLAGRKWHVPIIGTRVEADMRAHEDEERFAREHPAPRHAAGGAKG